VKGTSSLQGIFTVSARKQGSCGPVKRLASENLMFVRRDSARQGLKPTVFKIVETHPQLRDQSQSIADLLRQLPLLLHAYPHNMSTSPGGAVGPLPTPRLQAFVVIPKLRLLRCLWFPTFFCSTSCLLNPFLLRNYACRSSSCSHHGPQPGALLRLSQACFFIGTFR
jgi:hypothetical protein